MISCKIINLISTKHSSASLWTQFWARASLWSWTAQLSRQHLLLCLSIVPSFLIWCLQRLHLLSQSHHVPFYWSCYWRNINILKCQEAHYLPLYNVRTLEALYNTDMRIRGERRDVSAWLLFPQSGKPHYTPPCELSGNNHSGFER